MPVSRLSVSDKEYIQANYQRKTGAEMARIIGVNKNVVNRYQLKYGYQTPKGVKANAMQKIMNNRTISTPLIDRYLHDHYLLVNVNQLSIRLGKSETFVKTRLRQLNLIIPPFIIEQRKRESRIKPGNIPANKGKKMSPEVYEKAKATMFKKGGLPPNTKYDGAIRYRNPRKNRIGDHPYLFIRVSVGKWEMLHRYVWAQHHGPIPKGMNVVFKDGDTLNCDISNLEMITNKELMQRNTIARFPMEIQGVIHLIHKANKLIQNGTKQS